NLLTTRRLTITIVKRRQDNYSDTAGYLVHFTLKVCQDFIMWVRFIAILHSIIIEFLHDTKLVRIDKGVIQLNAKANSVTTALSARSLTNVKKLNIR
ncbi:hypothetical protein, partial [Pseudoalteromonas sp. MER144-MNA-CIBAN-0113]|uniref:hypothetical protein n=1 Tax=Pseudoalteromonas sp. MER144-MNA-CIBAN-0113 TaxID=3140429 RepID=UPI00331784AD